MISVIIPTLNSERLLVPTLSALVPGSAEGLVREVLLTDGGSRDGTETIADAAGCGFLRPAGDSGTRLRAAADTARGDWLMLLEPTSVLEDGWTREVGKFIENTEPIGQAGQRAATFRIAVEAYGIVARLADAARVMRFAVTGRPGAEQGLLMSRAFYDALGGFAPGEDSRARLARKIGRRRMIVLRTRILLAA